MCVKPHSNYNLNPGLRAVFLNYRISKWIQCSVVNKGLLQPNVETIRDALYDEEGYKN